MAITNNLDGNNTAVGITSHFSEIGTDPLRNFKFLVNVNRDVMGPTGKLQKYHFRMGFMSVSGFSVTTAPIPYRHGGQNTTPSMLPGQTSYQPISFSRGVLIGTQQNLSWFKQIFSVQNGGGNYVPNVKGKHDHAFRTTVHVYVMPHPRTDTTILNPVAHFTIFNAWPTTLSYSDLNAGDNAFILENMVLAHEGWDVDLANSYNPVP